MSKITIYVARHGKTLMNTLDMVQGWCDSPLTEEGIEVAEHLGRGLRDIEFRTAYCSTLRRTRQTAETVLQSHGQKDIPIIEKDGFKEAGFGSFEAGPNKTMWGNAALFLQYTSYDALYKDIVDKKISYNETLDAIKKLDTMGLAEDATTLRNRTQAALREIAEDEATKGEANILVIAHGMSILAMLGSLGGDKILKGHLDNAAVCKVIYENNSFTVETMGDMSYIEKGKNILAKQA